MTESRAHCTGAVGPMGARPSRICAVNGPRRTRGCIPVASSPGEADVAVRNLGNHCKCARLGELAAHRGDQVLLAAGGAKQSSRPGGVVSDDLEQLYQST